MAARPIGIQTLKWWSCGPASSRATVTLGSSASRPPARSPPSPHPRRYSHTLRGSIVCEPFLHFSVIACSCSSRIRASGLLRRSREASRALGCRALKPWRASRAIQACCTSVLDAASAARRASHDQHTGAECKAGFVGVAIRRRRTARSVPSRPARMAAPRLASAVWIATIEPRWLSGTISASSAGASEKLKVGSAPATRIASPSARRREEHEGDGHSRMRRPRWTDRPDAPAPAAWMHRVHHALRQPAQAHVDGAAVAIRRRTSGPLRCRESQALFEVGGEPGEVLAERPVRGEAQRNTESTDGSLRIRR